MDFYDKSKFYFTYHSKRHASQSTQEYAFSQLIPYIGNKRKLLPLIVDGIRETGLQNGKFLDMFSGSTVVGRMAKQMGFQTYVNDWEPYAYHLNRCFVTLNTEPEFNNLGGADKVFDILNNIKPREDWVAKNLCPIDDDNPDISKERMFFTRENGTLIDAIRHQIQEWFDSKVIDQDEFSYLIAPLLYSASYVSNTSGLFNAFHAGFGGGTKTGLGRIKSCIQLQKPILYNNGLQNVAFCQDAMSLAEDLSGNTDLDIVYLDPPYNQHSYGSNYHVLNSIALWDKPELPETISRGNKSAIRKDWQESRRSSYNYTKSSTAAYAELVDAVKSRYVLVSYSTEGNIPTHELVNASAQVGHLRCVMEPYQRYRVSKQRPSTRARTLEFVLVIDKLSKHKTNNGDEVMSRLFDAEKKLSIQKEVAV
jgi:adenine-specific DNA-methyltransferase